jgi:hypothetical protein
MISENYVSVFPRLNNNITNPRIVKRLAQNCTWTMRSLSNSIFEVSDEWNSSKHLFIYGSEPVGLRNSISVYLVTFMLIGEIGRYKHS